MASLDASENAGQGSVDLASAQRPSGSGTGDVDSVTATVPAVVNNTDPANPVINVSAVAPPPVGASSVGTSNDLARGTHSHTTLEVANVAALALVDCTAIANGCFAYVTTLKSCFELVATTRATQATSVIAALNKAASRWCRVLKRNMAFEAEATWFVDPVNGSDEAAGTTSATAIRSFAELNRRLYEAQIAQNTTINLLGNLASTDVNRWSFHVVPGIVVTVQGSLGATTGFGGAAINNTLFSGTVTAFAAAANAPTADQITMTDAAIPVSFTASGGLAAGVLYRRNAGGAVVHWYALKDNGAKTIRITSPNGNTIASTYQTLNVGDAYAAYAMSQMPAQFWSGCPGQVLVDSIYDISTAVENTGQQCPRRRRVWLGTQTTARGWGFGGWVNCMLEVAGSVILNGFQSLGVTTGPIGGAWRGTGASVVNMLRDTVILGCWMSQGAQLNANDGVFVAIETQWAMYDCTIPCLVAQNAARINSNTTVAGAGMSGVGNTGKILSLNSDGSFYYGASGANPPFIAGVTTDANPITIGATNYTVAALPAVSNTYLSASKQFPFGPTAVANGAVAVAWNNAPAGSPAAPVRHVAFPDGAGGFFTLPSLT